MEGDREESRLIREIFETISTKFSKKIERLAAIDAFLQFAQNPTSMSAGYGIEENYPLIERNLSERYGLGKIELEAIISFLKDSVRRMTEVTYDVYFWREVIKDYIRSKHLADFIEWYTSMYESLSEEERDRFLFLLYALSKTSNLGDIRRWHACFFDKEERMTDDEIRSILIRLGLGNTLYYQSSRGYVQYQFVPSLFLDDLREKFKDKIPVGKRQVEEFFSKLNLGDLRLLELCIKGSIPVLENRVGRVTRTSRLIVEASRSYFAISPFTFDKLKELIREQKLSLTRQWKKVFDEALNSFEKENYPYAEIKAVFEEEGAYCWEIRYVESPDKEPINICVLLAPYIFKITPYSTILDETRRHLSSRLNLIFLIRETLPSIADTFRYVNEKNLIFILNEEGKKFHVIERSSELHENEELLVNEFLSRFLPVIEKKVGISRTWPSHLKDYLENLKYLNRFPRLVSLRNSIPGIELKLREHIRGKLEKVFGQRWVEEVRKRLPKDVEKLKKIVEKRPDREEVKDFLDGATLGELIKILRIFSKELNVDKSGLEHLNLITQYRKLFEHPIKDRESDIDEETYNKLRIALEYVREVICLKT